MCKIVFGWRRRWSSYLKLPIYEIWKKTGLELFPVLNGSEKISNEGNTALGFHEEKLLLNLYVAPHKTYKNKMKEILKNNYVNVFTIKSDKMILWKRWWPTSSDWRACCDVDNKLKFNVVNTAAEAFLNRMKRIWILNV